MPLSAEIPAPVKNTIFFADCNLVISSDLISKETIRVFYMMYAKDDVKLLLTVLSGNPCKVYQSQDSREIYA
jgi:hypothetical protein